MSPHPVFVEADPQAAGGCFDAESIHLWRIPYLPSRGRTPLLDLLGAYLGKPADEVRLEQEPRGKPRLAGASGNPPSAPRLEFNWSHSGEYALVALARGLPLGVDIEHLGKHPRALEIARRFFHPDEADTLASLDAQTCKRAFISLWCAKEAVLKAAGEGLSFGLARLVFGCDAGCDWQMVRADPELGAVAVWQLAAFRAAPDYRGALAWRGGARRIVTFRPATGAPG